MKIAIVEDEAQALQTIIRYCEQYAAENGIPLDIVPFDRPVVFLEKYNGTYDAVFLDIVMPIMDGMECARRLRERDENVILCFVTSMAQYAIRGYEVGAVDFILKPVSFPEFCMKLDRIRRLAARRVEATVLISSKNGVHKIAVRDLSFVEVYNHMLIYHTDRERYEAYGKLSELEADERFGRFIRISASYLVNCDHITRLENEDMIVNGNRLPVSRRRRRYCLERMAQLLGGGQA